MRCIPAGGRGRFRPNVERVVPELASNRPDLSEFDRNMADIDPRLARRRPSLASIRQIWRQARPQWPEFGQVWHGIRQRWGEFDRRRPDSGLPRFGQHRVGCGKSRARVGQICGNSDRSWLELGKPRPESREVVKLRSGRKTSFFCLDRPTRQNIRRRTLNRSKRVSVHIRTDMRPIFATRGR